MNFHIVTIFPDAFESYLNSSMLWKAQDRKKILVRFYNPRDFVDDPHRRVDHRPYGGGPGMVMMAEPILRAVAAAKLKIKNKRPKKRKNLQPTTYNLQPKTIIFAPSGKQFTNVTARAWSKKYQDIIMIAGHYEGIDMRVKKILKAEEVSVGPYVLTGGELPAMLVIDAVTRQLPEVLGHPESLEEGRVASRELYTRPEKIISKGKTYTVPRVLRSGHHAKIEAWKKKRISKH